MKIFTGDLISQADLYTMEHEPLESINLMERAAESIAQWVCNNVPIETYLVFMIGRGGNGGDGLAAARMLYNAGYNCSVHLAYGKEFLSADCRFNLERLPKKITPATANTASGGESFPIPEGAVIIDALLGSGAREAPYEAGPAAPYIAPEGNLGSFIDAINASGCKVISIDMPSAMEVKASVTLAIQFPKLPMMFPESGDAGGEIVVLDIGLSEQFLSDTYSPYHYVDAGFAATLSRSRVKFAHKGMYGHALLVCGSRGMAGSAVLAAGGALRSGCGLVTVHLPHQERLAVHITYPCAIISPDNGSCFSELPRPGEQYSSIGVGPGIGKQPETVSAFEKLFRMAKPMVIDADAINIIAENQELIAHIPPGSIITPHLGELKRLIGEWDSPQERCLKVSQLAAGTSSVIVVKGAHTMTATPEGEFFFNSTGNPGMAKGGSGDILTGLLSGLLARGYQAKEAAILGVYLHGAAGNKAAEYYGAEGMNPADMIDFIGESFAELNNG